MAEKNILSGVSKFRDADLGKYKLKKTHKSVKVLIYIGLVVWALSVPCLLDVYFLAEEQRGSVRYQCHGSSS